MRRSRSRELQIYFPNALNCLQPNRASAASIPCNDQAELALALRLMIIDSRILLGQCAQALDYFKWWVHHRARPNTAQRNKLKVCCAGEAEGDSVFRERSHPTNAARSNSTPSLSREIASEETGPSHGGDESESPERWAIRLVVTSYLASGSPSWRPFMANKLNKVKHPEKSKLKAKDLASPSTRGKNQARQTNGQNEMTIKERGKGNSTSAGGAPRQIY